MKVTLAQAGIVAGILTLSWVVGGPKEAYSAPSTGEYPHNVFNTTSKAHAEKVASLVPDSIVRVDSGHEETYDPKTSSFSGKLWLVMSKTPDAEARSYFTPWLKENDYFRTNQFLSEVKYEAESFNADDDYTDEQLLKVARWDIENQIDRGAMYAIDEEPKAEHCDEDGNWEDGENFYTIVNLYAQYQEDEERAEKILWEMFKKEYPQYLGDGMAAESFSADSRWIGSHCRDCGEAKPFNEIEIMAGNARCKPGKGCKQFTKEQMEETQRQMRNEYPDLEWGAESLADRVPFPSSIPSAGTGSSGQMCEVCNESDDLPYDADYFKNCRRCGKAVCHECWDTHIESDDDYHEVCMDCWTVLDNVARYDAEGDVTEDLAEVRTDLSQKRTNMSALRTALSVAGLFLVWDSWRWSKEERKLKGL